MYKKLIIICFFSLLCYQCAYGYAAVSQHFIRLDGMHKFSPGDDPAWASADYDDTQWQSIHVPGNWQSQGISPVHGMGWYRIHFVLAGRLDEPEPAILLGRIGDIDEVF